MQAADSQVCQENCLHTNGCVGFSFTGQTQTCRLKSNIEYFQYSPADLAGQACFRPASYINITAVSREDILVSESPILSMVMTPNTSLDCDMLSSGSNHSDSHNERFRREIFPEDSLEDSPPEPEVPNIDFLLNPDKKSKKNEYEEIIMERLRHFFRDRNSSMLYPNLFRKGLNRNNDH